MSADTGETKAVVLPAATWEITSAGTTRALEVQVSFQEEPESRRTWRGAIICARNGKVRVLEMHCITIPWESSATINILEENIQQDDLRGSFQKIAAACRENSVERERKLTTEKLNQERRMAELREIQQEGLQQVP